MMDRLVTGGEGHTAISEDDLLALIPTDIATRADLIDAEQRNNSEALLRRPPTVARLLDDSYLRDLHRAMFGEVWRWAGRYRTRDTNIGIAFPQIATAVRELVADVAYWIEHDTFAPDEIAIRFHHRLVQIHPFANGNGRHGRFATDYLMRALGHEQFSWGAGLDVATTDLRARYVSALRRADDGDLASLLAFARS